MSTVVNGVVLLVYCFVVITCYVFVSSPFDDMMTGFQNVNLSNSDAQVENSASMGRIVFDMVFGGLILVPVVWFVYVTFYREPNWRFR